MKELKLLKEVKDKTLEEVIRKFGKGFGGLSGMKLSIWDVRCILYDEVNKIAKKVFDEENDFKKESFDRVFKE